jgi:structural maintenance of chromosomes protein 6
MTQDINEANKAISEKKKLIAEEEAKLQRDKQAEQEERRRNIEQLKTALKNAEDRLRETNDEIRDLDQRKSTVKAAFDEASASVKTNKQAADTCIQEREQVDNQTRDSVNIFGHNIGQLREQIKKARWHGKMPVGPLGLYVSLKDTKNQQWADIMRIVLARTMNSFAVTDARDQALLRQMLSQSNKCVHN